MLSSFRLYLLFISLLIPPAKVLDGFYTLCWGVMLDF
jgi:hypothetical protein